MRFEDAYVCAGCFEDAGLRGFIDDNPTQADCSYCNYTDDDSAVSELSQVAEHIETCLFDEYEDANNWGFYDSETKEFREGAHNTSEVLYEIELELPRDHRDRLRRNLVAALPDITWCERNPYSVNDRNRAQISWEIFCDVVKHRRRYFFEDYDDEIEYDAYSPGQIIHELFEYAEHLGLFKSEPAGKNLFRARFQNKGTELSTAQELGPTPIDFANRPNRMSPPSIPMFYAGDKVKTALIEIFKKHGTYAVGIFKTRRDMTILDLTQIPHMPSLFQSDAERLEYRPREVIRFLDHITTEISKPITKDCKAHINYVPTQVVTEFVRSQLTTGNRRIDGIKFGSSVHAGHASYVLFATQDNLVVPEKNRRGPQSKQWLELGDIERSCVSSERILKWKEEATRPRLPELPLFDAMNVD